METRANDFSFIHENEKPFRCSHLHDWIQNVLATVAKKVKLQLNAPKCLAHSMIQLNCTDMARHNYPAWHIERAGRWESNIWKKTCINANRREFSKISGDSVTKSLDDAKANSVIDY